MADLSITNKSTITIGIVGSAIVVVVSSTIWMTNKLSQVDNLNSKVASIEQGQETLYNQLEKVKTESQLNNTQIIDRLARFETKLDTLLDQSSKKN